MLQNLMFFSIFSLIVLMIFPAYAAVDSVSLEKAFYTNEELLTFVGVEEEGRKAVFVIVRGPSGNYIGMFSDPLSDTDGKFSTIPRAVESFFKSKGSYNATAFTNDQSEKNGISIQLEYDGNKVTKVENYVLTLRTIADKTITEGKTLSFSVSVTESSLDKLTYSLEKNPPSGASIDPDSGKFIWTPTAAQGSANGIQYNFDIVVEKGIQKDSESITITVKDPVTSQPKEEVKDEPQEEPRKESKVGVAPFVDQSKDPQSYVDRYNNEPSYKKWFDDNFPEYSSLYQAVGLKEIKEIAPFVDLNQDPQYYVDRYENEPSYKKWFDENFPEYDSIYEAVGLDEPEVIEQEIGECGPGTDLIDGICELIDQPNGGGCLIATATYGSEMAPQVQLLREIRDNKLMSTETGSSFVTGFNEIYYSFSPVIADYERENPMFKEAIKLGITPLISSLAILDYADSEDEIIGYGISLIVLNVGMYIAAPAIVIFKIRKFVKI